MLFFFLGPLREVYFIVSDLKRFFMYVSNEFKELFNVFYKKKLALNKYSSGIPIF